MNGSDFPARLLDGEKILWLGRPGQGLLFTGRDCFLIPFSLLWCGFVIFWETMVVRSNAPGFFKLWGVPFILAGLYLTVGRFAVDAWLRGKTRYALTSRRILIARSGAFGKVTSVSLDRLPEVQLTERADSRGTIRFGPPAPYCGWGGWNSWTPASDATRQLIAIDDAQNVFDQIQRPIRSAA